MSKSVSEALMQQAGVGQDPMVAVNALLAQGQLDAAQAVLDNLVKQAPRRADAWFGLGQLHARKGDFKPAAQAFKRAVQLAPDVADGYVHLGNLYLRNGRLGQATETYRNGLQRQPNDPLLHFNLGVALNLNGEAEAAIASFKQAIALHPSYAQAYFSLGNAYRELKRPQEAEAAYREAVRLEPRYADAHANLAGLLASEEKHLPAVEAALAALALAPDHIHALRNLSLSLYKLGRYAEGAEIVFRALAVAPDDTMLHYSMGEMLYGLIRLDETAKAQDFARRWRAMSNGHAVAEHMAAAILGEQTPARAGDTYVREIFDRFAQDFEKALSGLGYRVPEILSRAALEALGDRKDLIVLDAGCGTGLCAPYLKPAARKLIGVDLSGGMLAKARERGLYDALHETELGAFLAAASDQYDLTIAADVFCYFGDLQPSFLAIARKTGPQGVLGFTVEAAKGPAPEQGYRLGATGRYQHDAGYVRDTLRQAGFDILKFEETQGREEMGQPVLCYLILARKR
ncbi:MAG TPA: tetratricopeptide repeat protein [Ferrovibrio sp.]|uniref:tetratricopeptide repeat protein n=1 Tax=Ferrovibrio sp. TaxID=1917215 RepID=UPI002ED342C5